MSKVETPQRVLRAARRRGGASAMRIVAFLATALVGFAMIAEPAVSFAKAASATAPDLIFIGVTTLFLAVDARLIILARTSQGAWAQSCLWAGAVALALSAFGLFWEAEQEDATVFFGLGAALLGACLVLFERPHRGVRLHQRNDFQERRKSEPLKKRRRPMRSERVGARARSRPPKGLCALLRKTRNGQALA